DLGKSQIAKFFYIYLCPTTQLRSASQPHPPHMSRQRSRPPAPNVSYPSISCAASSWSCSPSSPPASTNTFQQPPEKTSCFSNSSIIPGMGCTPGTSYSPLLCSW